MFFLTGPSTKLDMWPPYDFMELSPWFCTSIILSVDLLVILERKASLYISPQFVLFLCFMFHSEFEKPDFQTHEGERFIFQCTQQCLQGKKWKSNGDSAEQTYTTEHNNLIHLLCVSTSGVSCHFPIFDVCAWFISTFNSIYLEGEGSSWIQSRGKLYRTSAAVWEKGNQLKGKATDVIFTIWSQLTFCCSCTYNLLEILPEYSIYMAGGVVFTRVFAYIFTRLPFKK